MTFTQIVFAVFVALWPQIPGQEQVASDASIAIADVAHGNPERAMRLLNQGRHETGLNPEFQLGCVEGYWCDGGKARGWWQLHDDPHSGLWEAIFGLEPENLRISATLADKRLGMCARYGLEIMYAAQDGRGCARDVIPDWAKLRAETHRELRILWSDIEHRRPIRHVPVLRGS